jgi:YHS domain-containing protein
MNMFLQSLTAACVMSVIVLGANRAVGTSEEQTSNPVQNADANKVDVTAQDASQKQPKDGTGKVNLDSQGVILKGYDVVAYFKQGKPVKGNPAVESAYRGATYLFTSAANKTDFDGNPAKYAPQYGAFCAYGVTNGVLFDPEGPGAFLVYKGRLYVCGNQGALKEFKKDIESNIEKADANWLQLAGR